MGPAYPMCVRLVCPQGCIHGTYTAAGQCTCDAGHEGIACQFPADLSDTIEWSISCTGQVHAPETIRAAPPAASVLVNTDLCMIEHADTVTVALVPIRVRSKGSFAPWRRCEVEVATDYQYLIVTPMGGSADATYYYALPYRSIVTDEQALTVTVTTKSGTVLEIQARDPVNLSEWVQVLNVGPDLNVLASVASRVRAPTIEDAGFRRVPPAKDPSKGSAPVPRKGMLKSASIRR